VLNEFKFCGPFDVRFCSRWKILDYQGNKDNTCFVFYCKSFDRWDMNRVFQGHEATASLCEYRSDVAEEIVLTSKRVERTYPRSHPSS